jgi:hypothetical protein
MAGSIASSKLSEEAVIFYRLLLLVLTISIGSPAIPPAQVITADTIIDEALQVTANSASQDLIDELTVLSQRFVDDTSTQGLVGAAFIKSRPSILYFLGSTVSTMSMVVPLLPGTVADTGSPRGRLAAKLRAIVVTYLLSQSYWNWESTSTGSPALLAAANPNVPFSWEHGSTGPYWEKFYALWAYAHYTGDWSLIQTNWAFIKARYQSGDPTPDPRQRSVIAPDRTKIYRSDANDLASGLIGYARMATYMNDPTAATARTQAQAALDYVLTRLDSYWDASPAFRDANTITIRGEWSPGHNLTPEIGRWVNGRALTTAQSRLNHAVNASELRGRWWTGPALTYWHGNEFADEDYSGNANLSEQLFVGRAWMLLEDGAQLRPVRLWPTAVATPAHRDTLYMRGLYALTSRQAVSSWQPSTP